MRRTFALPLIAVTLLSGCSATGLPRPPYRPPAPPPAGTFYRLWQDAAIFACVHSLLDRASPGQELWVEMYEFDRSDLAAELLSARARGADVRLMVDRTVPVSSRTADALSGAGLPVRAYPVDDARHQIDHVKLVLSGGTALVGGMNWGSGSAGNHDYALETALPTVVARLSAIFAQDWALAGDRVAPAPPASGRSAAVAQTTPGEEVRAALVAGLRSARTSVQAEVFVLTDQEVIAALAGARRRGARVRVLLDPEQDVNRAGMDLVQAAGVEARWYPVPQGTKLHAKAVLFDGSRLLLGSANWSQGGLSVNHELDLVSDDPGAAAAYARRFEQDWSASG
jgi:phosphatidylserine/phosphatidylglycerophosphate/cardiolipin synthase-like enzyme